jgi:hypothetical protein
MVKLINLVPKYWIIDRAISFFIFPMKSNFPYKAAKAAIFPIRSGRSGDFSYEAVKAAIPLYEAAIESELPSLVVVSCREVPFLFAQGE